jgi:hypothetical protein
MYRSNLVSGDGESSIFTWREENCEKLLQERLCPPACLVLSTRSYHSLYLVTVCTIFRRLFMTKDLPICAMVKSIQGVCVSCLP